MKTVAIIDYGMGNLHSARKAVEHVAPDTRVLVTDNADKIREADREILPG
ncbi:MAG: imidazole glycerol phosphate synthase subunit HisH, partial [Marinobacter sp.]